MGIALLYLGMSCRQTAEVLRFFDEASYEAARQWYHRAQNMLSAPQKRYRPTVAIDETKVKEGGGNLHGTILPLGGGRYREQGRELLGVSLTHADTRRPRRLPPVSYNGCYRRARTNTPTVLVDGGPWYGIQGRYADWACPGRE